MTTRILMLGGAACAAFMVLLSGCAATGPNLADRAERLEHGYVVYFDGAGGGSALTNWGPGVKQGLLAAGYQGAGEEFVWETGWGVMADQEAAVAYKRTKAAEAAQHVKQYAQAHPGQPITLMGLSAGTAVVVFALEALPESIGIQTVVLLSGSLSSGYDLTKALKRVKGNMYVTTSPHDAILSGVVPLTGSADRKDVGDDVVGVHGCHVPQGASAETRRLYSKIVILAWKPSFLKFGDAGGHTDTASASFVQHVIAPLVIREGPRHLHVHPRGSAGTYSTAGDQ